MNDEYLARAMDKIPDKRTLIVIASKRAKQLMQKEKPLIKNIDGIEYLDVALLEIAEGLIGYEDVEEKEID